MLPNSKVHGTLEAVFDTTSIFEKNISLILQTCLILIPTLILLPYESNVPVALRRVSGRIIPAGVLRVRKNVEDLMVLLCKRFQLLYITENSNEFVVEMIKNGD